MMQPINALLGKTEVMHAVHCMLCALPNLYGGLNSLSLAKRSPHAMQCNGGSRLRQARNHTCHQTQAMVEALQSHDAEGLQHVVSAMSAMSCNVQRMRCSAFSHRSWAGRLLFSRLAVQNLRPLRHHHTNLHCVRTARLPLWISTYNKINLCTVEA